MRKYKNQLSRVIAQEARKKKQITKSKGSIRRKMLNSNLLQSSHTLRKPTLPKTEYTNRFNKLLAKLTKKEKHNYQERKGRNCYQRCKTLRNS